MPPSNNETPAKESSFAQRTRKVAVDRRATGSLTIRTRVVGAITKLAPRPAVAGYRRLTHHTAKIKIGCTGNLAHAIHGCAGIPCT